MKISHRIIYLILRPDRERYRWPPCRYGPRRIWGNRKSRLYLLFPSYSIQCCFRKSWERQMRRREILECTEDLNGGRRSCQAPSEHHFVFFSFDIKSNTSELCWYFRKSSSRKAIVQHLFAAVRSRDCFYRFWISIQRRANPRSYRIRGSIGRAIFVFCEWNYRSLCVSLWPIVSVNIVIIGEPEWSK